MGLFPLVFELHQKIVEPLPHANTKHYIYPFMVYNFVEINNKYDFITSHFRQIDCISGVNDVYLPSIGATVQFTCDEDHVLQGSKTIICQRIAEVFAAWSDHRPACKGEQGF